MLTETGVLTIFRRIRTRRRIRWRLSRRLDGTLASREVTWTPRDCQGPLRPLQQHFQPPAELAAVPSRETSKHYGGDTLTRWPPADRSAARCGATYCDVRETRLCVYGGSRCPATTGETLRPISALSCAGARRATTQCARTLSGVGNAQGIHSPRLHVP